MDSPGLEMPKPRGRLLPLVGVLALTLCVFSFTQLPFSSDLTGEALLTYENSLFRDFEAKFEKTYASEEERNYRNEVFRTNVKRHAQYQRENPQASFGVTKFADMTQEEFEQRYAAREPGTPFQQLNTVSQGISMPKNLDWRKFGLVRPVQDEGSCASHYAISVASALEFLWGATVGKFLILSEQQILDCSTLTQGCNGGDTTSAFNYVLTSSGVQPQFSYPSSDTTGKCSTDVYYTKLYADAVYSFPPNETGLQEGLYMYGPMSVTLNVDSSFAQYTGGILKVCGTESSQVSGLLVGYGFSWWHWSYYWTVQMSFGTEFGDEGVVYLARNPTNQGTGVCGLTEKVLLPYFYS